MPQTSAERQGRYRERQLLKDPEGQREREREKMQKYRRNLSANQKEVSNELAARRMRRKYRKDRGLPDPESDTDENVPAELVGAYKTLSAERKAMNRTLRALPKSPSKKRKIIFNLMRENNVRNLDQEDDRHLDQQLETISDSARLMQDAKAAAVRFYESEGASRVTPGRSQFKAVKLADGTKQQVQLRYLTFSLKETFRLFCIENEGVELGKSTFASLRPPHVKLCAETEHNVCLCIHHENFQLLVSALHSRINDFPAESRQLLAAGCCSVNDENCMLGDCDSCMLDAVPGAIVASTSNDTVIFKQWAKNEDDRVVQVSSQITVSECYEKLLAVWKLFKTHVFIQKKQANSFRAARASATHDSTTAVLQVDFAENYVCHQQDEVQSTYFSLGSVTVFTAVYWLNDDTGKSIAIVSDDTSHGSLSVYAFLRQVMSVIKAEAPELKRINVWSDGCAAQFKSRYTFANLTFLQEELGIELSWSFFATSHGKGAVDAVGATVKRCVWNAVRARVLQVTNARTFFEAAQRTTNVRTFLITADEMKVIQHEDHVVYRKQELEAVTDTKQKHNISVLGPYLIECRLFNDDVSSTIDSVRPKVVNQRKRKRRQEQEQDDEDEDADEDADADEDEDEDADEDEDEEGEEELVAAFPPEIIDVPLGETESTAVVVEVDAFYVVAYELQRSVRRYVGRVVRLYDDLDGTQMVNVQFYRRLRTNKSRSSSSVAERAGDTDDVESSALMQKLTVKHLGRNITFLEDLSHVEE